MSSTKKRKLPDWPFLLALFVFVVSLGAQQQQGLMVPPVANGGVLGLWEFDHTFIEATYGPFELLNFKSAPYVTRPASPGPHTWQLTSLGNYLGKGVQFAALARLINRPDSTLLIVFEWKEHADSSGEHGVFLHEVLPRADAAIRTKQGTGGIYDTLEIAYGKPATLYAKCWTDTISGIMHLHRTTPNAAD